MKLKEFKNFEHLKINKEKLYCLSHDGFDTQGRLHIYGDELLQIEFSDKYIDVYVSSEEFKFIINKDKKEIIIVK